MASRYASFDSRSRSRTSSTGNPTPPPSKALVSTTSSRALSKPQQSNIGAMVRKLIAKPKLTTGSGDRKCLAVPFDVIAEDAKKARRKGSSNFSSLHRKLFQKGGGEEKVNATTNRALTEVKSNTRTLSMVLRSERELLDQNKAYEGEVLDLQLALEEKNREVEKLKDLCLKQRDEIKTLKDAILFPDVMNSQLQELLEIQGSDFKQAKGVIPTLQKQVTSLTGKLLCLAEDLAEVKAEKNNGRSCYDGRPLKSPRSPTYNKHEIGSLDFNSMRLIDSGSPVDDMLLRDLNPCLTPCFSKTKSKEYDEMLSDDFLSEDDESFGKSSQSTCHMYDDKVCKSSSEHFRQHTNLRHNNQNRNSYGTKSSSSGKVLLKPKSMFDC